MESYVFAFRLTLDDWRAYQKECALHLRQTISQGWKIALAFAVVLIVFGAFVISDALGTPLQPWSVIAGLLFAVIALWLRWRFLVNRYAPVDGGTFYEERRYLFDSQGMRITCPGIDALTRWSVVRSVTSTAEYLYLWVDRIQAHIIPWRALSTGVSKDDLLAAVERWRREGTPEAAPAEPLLTEPVSAASAAPEEPGPERRSWISGLSRLLTLRHARGMKDAPGWLVWLLAGLALIAWVGVDRMRTGPDAMFDPFGAPDIAWYVLILLAVAAALSLQSRPRAPLRNSVVSLLALMLVLFALKAVAIFVSAPKAAMGIGALVAVIYCIVVAARMLRSMTGREQPGAVASAVVVLVAALWLTDQIYVDPGVWYPLELDASADDSGYWDRTESLLFEQPARIDAAIAQIEPSDGESPAAFFVGFAGYGEQRVFAEEIKLAARVLGERYGSRERSVLLLNDRRDLDSHPIATATSLRYALRELATKMDVDEDILFLSLSSHGTEDSLLVSNDPLMLQDLTDEALAAALRDSGIKWRVIVISACYAGSFIDALRDPNTVIITAAAADRTSFGCSDDRDLTYFGEAFYRDALPGAASLRQAFEMAVDEIAERERKEDIEASKPQAYFGEAIERRLEQVPARPQGIAVPADTSTASSSLKEIESCRRRLTRWPMVLWSAWLRT